MNTLNSVSKKSGAKHDGKWVFRSRSGGPLNPGNMLKRHVRPAVKELGIEIGGWHDFRHTLATRSLKKWPTKVVSEILGHSDVVTTLKIYQHIETDDFRGPLNELAGELLRDVTKSASADSRTVESKGDGAEGET